MPKGFIIHLMDSQMNWLGEQYGYIMLLVMKNTMKNIVLLQMLIIVLMILLDIQDVKDLYHGMIKDLELMF